MERRVLQQLRGAPFDPGVRRFCELRVKLLDQPRLAEPWFAYNEHELAFARASTIPAACEQAQFLLAADKGRQRPCAAPSAATARSNDAKKLDRLGNTLEFARALLLRDKEPGDLALDVSCDQDGSGLSSSLDARRHVRRFTEHFAGRVYHDQAALKADTGG